MKRTEASRKKMSDAANNRWKNPEERKKQSEYTTLLWQDPTYRKKQMEICRDPLFKQKKSKTITKKFIEDPEYKKAIGEANRRKAKDPIYRKKLSISIKQRYDLDDSYKESRSRENCHLWKGGISFEPYCVLFNNEFKERTRAWFGYACVECGTPQNGKSHTVHHVNYDKMMCCNDVKPLFVCLCNSCNGKANFNRPYWEQHFTDMIEQYYGGRCYLTKEEMKSYNTFI